MSSLPLGSTLAGCRLEVVAGRGGMGVIYRATQLALGRPVAVKAIAPELAEDQEFRERFKREARIAASIDHPNVIPVYEAGELGGTLYLIMRWVDGTDLRRLLGSEGRLSARRALGLLRPVALALSAAHRRGLVHRDVKPANVLIAGVGAQDDEHVYLTDFGIARRTDAEAMTRTGLLVGTLDYTSPARLEGGKGTPADDIYSFGCVLFEALTGHVPFDRPTDVAKIFAHMNDPVPAARAEIEGVPEQLDALIAKAMAKRPEERFASAGELALAVDRVLREVETDQIDRSAAPTRPSLRQQATKPGRADRTQPGARTPATGRAADRAAAGRRQPAARTPATGRATDRAAAGRPAPAAAGAPSAPEQAPMAAPAAADGVDPAATTATEPAPAVEAAPPAATEPPSTLEATPAGVVSAGAEAGRPPIAEPGRAPAAEPGRAAAERDHAGRRRALLASALVLLVAAAVAVALIAGGGSAQPVAQARGNGLSVAETISLGATPGVLTVGPGGEVWVSLPGRRTVARVNPRTSVITPFSVTGRSTAIAAGTHGIWVGSADGSLTRLDPLTGAPLASAQLDAGIVALTVDQSDGSVWTADGTGNVTHLGLDGHAVASPAQVSPSPVAIGWGEGWVWAVNGATTGGLVRVSLAGGPSATAFNAQPGAVSVTFDQGVWTAHATGDVTRFDPRPGHLTTNGDAHVAPSLEQVSAAEGYPSVWAIGAQTKSLFQISNTSSPSVTGTVTFTSPPVGLIASGHSVWVATQAGNLVQIDSQSG